MLYNCRSLLIISTLDSCEYILDFCHRNFFNLNIYTKVKIYLYIALE